MNTLPPLAAVNIGAALEDIGFAIGFLERHDDNNPDFEFDAGGALAALRIIRGALKPLVDRDRTAIGQSAVTRVINETVEARAPASGPCRNRRGAAIRLCIARGSLRHSTRWSRLARAARCRALRGNGSQR